MVLVIRCKVIYDLQYKECFPNKWGDLGEYLVICEGEDVTCVAPNPPPPLFHILPFDFDNERGLPAFQGCYRCFSLPKKEKDNLRFFFMLFCFFIPFLRD
jgi:hypothetical protein